MYGRSNFTTTISSIQTGSLKSSYGITQWHLLIPPTSELTDPSIFDYSGKQINYGSGYTSIPNNSLPTTANITTLTSVVTNDPQNFSQTAGVTTSTNALSATIKLLPESAIDGLVSPFKMLSPLLSNGVYPVTNYSVGNSGRAALNFKIGNVPTWVVTDPTQTGKVPAVGANAVKFQVKSGVNGCPKAPFTGLARPLYRLFDLQDTKVVPTSTNDPSMASNQTVAAEPKDAILDGSSLDRTATFHTLAVCATAELANFDTSAIAWTPGVGGAEKTLTFKNGGGPQKSELEAIETFKDSKVKAFTPAEITQIKGWTDLDYEVSVTTIGANPGGATLTATVNGKTTGLLAAKDTATIKLTAVCKGTGNPKFQIKLNAKNEPDPDMRVKTIDVTLTCAPPKPKPVITPPTGLTITAPIGSTASGSFTLENAGDVDSTLDYIVYRPGQTASVQIAASTPISTRALPPGSGFPGPIGSVDARFTSPSETTGSLLKVSATTAASTTIPVSATCSTVGSFSSVIDITYATGDLTPTGTPVFASSDVTVNVTCTGAIYSGDQGGGSINLTAKVGETATSSAIGYSNTGIGSSSDPATLTTSITTNASWLTVTPSSSSVAPGNGSSFVITASCVGLAAGTYSGVVTLSTNTGQTFTWTVNLTCTGNPKLVAAPFTTAFHLNDGSYEIVVLRNEGNGNLDITSISGVTITSPLAGAYLEIGSNPAPTTIVPNSHVWVEINFGCGDTQGTISGYITVNSNDPSSPTQVPISLKCVGGDVEFTADEPRDFFGSWSPWSGPAKSFLKIKNTSIEPVDYDVTFENSGPTLDAGTTGTIAGLGENTISFTAGCGDGFKTANGGFTPNFPNRYYYTLLLRNKTTDKTIRKPITLRCFGVSVAAFVTKWHTYLQQFHERLYPLEPESPNNPLIPYWRYAAGCALTSPTTSVCPSKDSLLTQERWRTHNDYFEAAKVLLDPLIGLPTEGGWRQECFNNDCVSMEFTDIPPVKIETWASAKSRIPPFDN